MSRQTPRLLTHPVFGIHPRFFKRCLCKFVHSRLFFQYMPINIYQHRCQTGQPVYINLYVKRENLYIYVYLYIYIYIGLDCLPRWEKGRMFWNSSRMSRMQPGSFFVITFTNITILLMCIVFLSHCSFWFLLFLHGFLEFLSKVHFLRGRFPIFLGTNLSPNLGTNLWIHQLWGRIWYFVSSHIMIYFDYQSGPVLQPKRV